MEGLTLISIVLISLSGQNFITFEGLLNYFLISSISSIFFLIGSFLTITDQKFGFNFNQFRSNLISIKGISFYKNCNLKSVLNCIYDLSISNLLNKLKDVVLTFLNSFREFYKSYNQIPYLEYIKKFDYTSNNNIL